MLTALHAHVDETDASEENRRLAKLAYAFLSEDSLRSTYELLLQKKFRDALGVLIRDFAIEA